MATGNLIFVTFSLVSMTFKYEQMLVTLKVTRSLVAEVLKSPRSVTKVGSRSFRVKISRTGTDPGVSFI